MRPIPYFWIRDVDPQTYMRVLKMARARKQSVADTARDLLDRYSRMDGLEQIRTPRFATTRKTRVKLRTI
jgi:hypothetical protein